MTLQFDRALALADAHGHEWATAVWRTTEDPEGPRLPKPHTFAEADVLHRRWLEESGYRGPDGLFVPVLDDQGRVNYRTGTGRLSWEIWPDGECVFGVYRPVLDAAGERTGDERAVLAAVVEPSGAVEVYEHGAAFERHWEALWRALCQATSETDLRKAAPIFDQHEHVSAAGRLVSWVDSQPQWVAP